MKNLNEDVHSPRIPMKKSTFTLSALLLLGSFPLMAANWGQWRGPNFNGTSPEKNLPSSFSKTENVAWSIKMPGKAAATPAVWDDKVFIATTHDRAKTLHAQAYDRATGKLIWNEKVGDGYDKDNRSNYAAPSPATDGKRVIFFYGNGDLASFTLDGKLQWRKNLQDQFGEFAFQWTFSTSPLLHKDMLYMQILQRDVPVRGSKSKTSPDGKVPSFLLALEPDTGKEIFNINRKAKAQLESLEAFSTPIPYTHNGREEILVVGGDCLTGHDPKTGKEFWRWGTWNPSRITHWRLVPSPVAGNGVVLACAPKKAPVYAAKLGKNGDTSSNGLAWDTGKNPEVSSDVPTPAFHDGDFFVLSDVRNAMSRVDGKTGKVEWSTELPRFRKWRTSPTVADGKIYIMNHGGDVKILSEKTGEILHSTSMGQKGDDGIRSSIVVSQGNLFIRTNSELYCIGKKPTVAAK